MDTFYVPKHFRETDTADLHKLMRENPFATLITVSEGLPVVSHLPFIFDFELGEQGTLYAHMALGNQQWKTLKETQEALVIFQGPHAYITPSWYDDELSVPTWNYAVVHAYGRPRIFEDQAEFYQLLAEQVQTYEAPFTQPWPITSLSDEFMQKKMLGIVGFALEITRLDGKFKLSQNRSEHERVHVAEKLAEDGETASASILMQEREQKS
jgi:transcriptional regulator